MKLYDLPWGPYPMRVTIYLREKGLDDVEIIKLEPSDDKKTNWVPHHVKGLTPIGSLPVFVDDDGTAVGQSLAILEYLEETKTGPDLMGATAAARARTREAVAVFDEAVTFFGMWARHGSDVYKNSLRESRDAAEIGAERYGQKLRVAEQMIGDNAFVAGPDVTIADCVAMATLQFAAEFYSVPIPEDCPKLAAWYDRFAKRPSIVPLAIPDSIFKLSRGLPSQTGITI